MGSQTLGAQAPVAQTHIEDKRPVAFEDIMSLKSVGAPQISMDGASVLYTVSVWEKEEEERMSFVSHVWRVSAEGGDARQLTFGEKGESAPRWSPDGTWMSFLAARAVKDDKEPKQQVWLMPAAGGEATRLTDAKEGVADYSWSPDSQRIAFVSKDPLSDEEENKKDRRDDPLLYEEDHRLHRLWVIDVSSRVAEIQTGTADFTVKGRPSWAPDGRQIVFTGAPTLWLRDSRDDVYVSMVGGESRKISDNPGADRSPSWSPDGTRIAFLSNPNDSEPLPDGTPIQPLVNARLMIYYPDTGTIEDVSAEFDRIPSNPRWTPDSTRILFTAGDSVYREVFAYEIAAKRYEKLTNNAYVGLGSWSTDGSRVAYTLESATMPAEVYVSALDFGASKKLSDVHSEMRELALGETEIVRWKSTEGFEVEGILLKPVGYQPGKRYPLMTVAHGGPTGAHHDYFRVRYGDGGQHWAGQGWAVLYPNPRGSTNYGEAFMRRQPRRLGWWGLSRHHGRCRCRHRYGDRKSRTTRLSRVELWRIYDLLDRVANDAIQSSDARRRTDESGEHVRHKRFAQLSRHFLQWNLVAGDRAALSRTLRTDLRRPGHHPDLDPPWRQR